MLFVESSTMQAKRVLRMLLLNGNPAKRKKESRFIVLKYAHEQNLLSFI